MADWLRRTPLALACWASCAALALAQTDSPAPAPEEPLVLVISTVLADASSPAGEPPPPSLSGDSPLPLNPRLRLEFQLLGQGKTPSPATTQALSLPDGAKAAEAERLASLRPAPARARCWDLAWEKTTLDLLTAVQRALCHSPRAQEAEAQVGVQRAEVGVARASYWPQISANLGMGKNRQSTRVADPLLAPLINMNTSPRVRNASLKASMVLLDFGARSALVEQASALLESSQAGYDGTWQSVLFSTAEAYYAARRADNLRQSRAEAENLAGQSAATAQAKYKAGIVALSDQLQAELALRQASLERMQAELELKIAQAALARLIGAPPGETFRLSTQAEDLPSHQQLKSLNELVDTATLDHPEVRAARAALQAADAKLRATRAEGLPRVVVAAETARNDQLGQPPSLGLPSTDTFQRSQQVTMQLSVPLFEGFGRQAQVEAAAQRRAAKAAALDTVEQQVRLDVWQSYNTLTTALQLLGSATDLQRSARKAFDIASGRYRDGVGNILELLNAQNSLARATQQKLEAATQYQTARLRLAAGVGQLTLANF